MPLVALLAGLVVVALAFFPAGRRLVATFVDLVDGSVGMFAIRRALGLDTTTARQRRIDRRHANEEADLARRIGVTEAAVEAIAQRPRHALRLGSWPSVSPSWRRRPMGSRLASGCVSWSR